MDEKSSLMVCESHPEAANRPHVSIAVSNRACPIPGLLHDCRFSWRDLLQLPRTPIPRHFCGFPEVLDHQSRHYSASYVVGIAGGSAILLGEFVRFSRPNESSPSMPIQALTLPVTPFSAPLLFHGGVSGQSHGAAMLLRGRGHVHARHLRPDAGEDYALALRR